jgi:membrane dipeptidase
MKIRSYIILSALILFSLCLSIQAQERDEELRKKAEQIHLDAIVIDAHAHPMTTQGFLADAGPDTLDLGRKTKYSVIDFVTMKEGGLDAVFYSIPLLNDRNAGNPSKRILDDLVLLRNHIDHYSRLAEIALTPSDIRRIHKSGKRAILFGIESVDCLEGHPVLLETYHKMGVRMITLAHTKTDPIADTDTEEEGGSGLSPFGRDVIREMNRLGVLIDITHCPDNLQLSIIEESKAPVIASHSCVRALNDKPREMPDGIIRKLADKGGAIMIAFGSSHLSYEYAEKNDKAYGTFYAEKTKLEEKYKDSPAELAKQVQDLKDRTFEKGVSIDLLIDHIDHAVKVAGIDHVGLGSDTLAGVGSPVGLETAAGYPLITYRLLKRGYKAEDIKKILGENMLRVFSQIQSLSAKLNQSVQR